MPYAVRRLYHTTHWVPDLDEAARFFSQVFGRESQSLPEFLGYDERTLDPSYPVNYCRFTPIAEVLFDSIDPELHLVDGDSTPRERQRSAPRCHRLVRRRRRGPVDRAAAAEHPWHRPGQEGTRGRRTTPRHLLDADRLHSSRVDTGLAYEFCPYFPSRDPRGDPPAPALSPSDPLGIERCSHHTVLTDRLDRARRLLVDVLGGRVIHKGRNDVLATDSTYVWLAGGVYELAQPFEVGSPAMEDWHRSAPQDAYHSLTWQVRDLGQVADHLKASGVALRAYTDTQIVTDAADSLGIPWGFTTVLTPGDPRV